MSPAFVLRPLRDNHRLAGIAKLIHISLYSPIVLLEEGDTSMSSTNSHDRFLPTKLNIMISQLNILLHKEVPKRSQNKNNFKNND